MDSQDNNENNNAYAYQQMPPNLPNQESLTYPAATYRPTGVPHSPQQYPQQTSLITDGKLYFPDPVTTYCTMIIIKINKINSIQQETINHINNEYLGALRQIWESLPLNFQFLYGNHSIYSQDYIENQILNPLILANPSIPAQTIIEGKVLSASRILHQGIRKSTFLTLITMIVFFGLITILELIYADHSSYFSEDYAVTFQFIGIAWMIIQSCMIMIGIRFASLKVISIVSIFSSLLIFFNAVILISGIITLVNQYETLGFIFFLGCVGILFIITSIIVKASLSKIKFCMSRLFVLIKLLPENEVNQKLCDL